MNPKPDWAEKEARGILESFYGEVLDYRVLVGRMAERLRITYSRGVKEAAMIAEDCYHGPKDHGCNHGQEIAKQIRVLVRELEEG